MIVQLDISTLKAVQLADFCSTRAESLKLHYGDDPAMREEANEWDALARSLKVRP